MQETKEFTLREIPTKKELNTITKIITILDPFTKQQQERMLRAVAAYFHLPVASEIKLQPPPKLIRTDEDLTVIFPPSDIDWIKKIAESCYPEDSEKAKLFTDEALDLIAHIYKRVQQTLAP